jgi:hypothetical protein
MLDLHLCSPHVFMVTCGNNDNRCNKSSFTAKNKNAAIRFGSLMPKDTLRYIGLNKVIMLLNNTAPSIGIILHGDESSVSRPSHFNLGKDPSVPLNSRLGGRKYSPPGLKLRSLGRPAHSVISISVRNKPVY